MFSFKQFIVETQFNPPTIANVGEIQAQFDHLQENPDEKAIHHFLTNWAIPLRSFVESISTLATTVNFNDENAALPKKPALDRIINRINNIVLEVFHYGNPDLKHMDAHINFFIDSMKETKDQIIRWLNVMPPPIQQFLNQFISYLDKTLPMLKVVTNIASQLEKQEYPF